MTINAEQVFDVLIKMKADGMDLSACEVFGLINEDTSEETEFWPETVEEVEGCLTFK